MDTTLVNAVTSQILTFIRDSVLDSLAEIVEAKVDEDQAPEIVAAMKKKMAEMIEKIPKTAPAASTSRSSSSSGSRKSDASVLKGPDGTDLLCEAVKKSGESCTHKAKHTINGKHYCGVHEKSVRNAQSDPNAAPKGAKAKAKGNNAAAAKAAAGSFDKAVTGSSSFSVEDLEADVDDLDI